jgi:hypothetical protein
MVRNGVSINLSRTGLEKPTEQTAVSCSKCLPGKMRRQNKSNSIKETNSMKHFSHRRARHSVSAILTVLTVLAAAVGLVDARAADKKPNVVFIMGDDVGWFNLGAYHQGMMAGRTPNLDRLAKEGMRFTDYYGGKGASFNLEALKAELEKKMEEPKLSPTGR